jgi:hypothetical protein
MTVVLDRPYEFVPPHRGNLWPWLIQTFHLYEPYLRKKEGVLSHEIRGLENFKQPLQRGDGILLAPNHCRYSDPLVLGWPARAAGTYLHAMASWHLFNGTKFDRFAVHKMGAFSVYREGPDRQSLDTAITILANAERPLVLFPEGSTNRTNDVLKPLLEGVTFIARAAARRRAKESASQISGAQSQSRRHRGRRRAAGGSDRVVLIPVAIKYLCKTDITPWADVQLAKIEQHLGWHRRGGLSILNRTIRLAEALLSLREIEYLGKSNAGPLPHRRDYLIQWMLKQLEQDLNIRKVNHDDIRARILAIRSKIASEYEHTTDPARKQALRASVVAVVLVQDISSYPDCYLRPDQTTDTRIVETIQRMQETLFGRADGGQPLHVVIQFDEPIPVPPEKSPRGETDPLLIQLADRLKTMLDELSRAANPIDGGENHRSSE